MNRGAATLAARLSVPRHVRGPAAGALAAACVLAWLPADRASAQGAAPAPPPAASNVADQPPANNVGANLNISPKRVTFDRNTRTATVYVFNQGTAPATFDISMIDRVMLPDGQIVSVEDAEAKPDQKPYADRVKSAKPLLIVTPRRATLEPGKGQTLRLRLGSPEGGDAGNPPAAGELRTHLTVTTIPPRDVGLTAEQAAGAGPQALSFQISAVFGISIPVIVRTGAPDVRGAIEKAQVGIQNVSADGVAPPKATPVLSLQLVRLGPNSLFGNIEVHSARDRNGAPIGQVRGVGVYPEVDRRDVQILLTRAPAPGEQLNIEYKDDDTSPGRTVATATVTAP